MSTNHLGDAGVLESVHKQALADGGTGSSTIAAITLSDLVRTTQIQETK